MPVSLSEKARAYLWRLCDEIPSRHVGSAGNRAATDLVAEVMASFGFETECPAFDCMDWEEWGVALAVGGTPFQALASPYSHGCRASAPLAVATTVDELAAMDASDQVLLLRGEIAGEQLMPKNFPFYNPDHHKRIIQLLEDQGPQAIIAATARNPEMAGAVYPLPLIEDGDFHIPSAYMTEQEGDGLARLAGQHASLEIRARRIPSQGCNVIARKGEGPHRVVFMAHIDAKRGTSGATDNAAGIVILLLLAELLADYAGEMGVELVAMNGEDHYSAPGEMAYLRANQGRFQEVLLGINLDGAGYHQGRTAYSLYECTAPLADAIGQSLAPYEELVPGEAWYQGDHALFLMNQRPALALTSERAWELLAQITHTPQDRPEIVDVAKLVRVAVAMQDLLGHLEALER